MKFSCILSIIVLIFLTYTNLGFSSEIDKSVKIDRILVEKSKRLLHIYSNDKLLKTYKISLGKNPVGAKKYAGDNKTPEGKYYIDKKIRNSSYHKTLQISYPNEKDKKETSKSGKNPGGQIGIHGLKNNEKKIRNIHLKSDWTMGCIALTNEEIDELFDIVEIGTIVEIVP